MNIDMLKQEEKSTVTSQANTEERVLKFTLSCPHFHMTEETSNENVIETYRNPHKLAILGMLGNMLGLKGYNNKTFSKSKSIYPEWYEKLQDLKVAVVNNSETGTFISAVNEYSNTTGLHEADGNTLLIKENWLYNTSWTVYVLGDSKIIDEIADRMENRKYNGMLYLGKSQHYVEKIKDAERISLEDMKRIDEDNLATRIDSLFIDKNIEVKRAMFGSNGTFEFIQRMPVKFRENTVYYFKEMMKWTDKEVVIRNAKESNFYEYQEKVIQFI